MDPQSRGKLKFLYYGPFKVAERINDNAYRLHVPLGYRKHDVLNIKSLKMFNSRVANYNRVAPVTDDEIRQNLNNITEVVSLTGDMAEVLWQDCDICDTTRIPVRWLRTLPDHKQRFIFGRFFRTLGHDHPNAPSDEEEEQLGA